MLPYPEYIKSLPKKIVASGALIFGDSDRTQILVLKMTYKDSWVIPGGVVDSGESPTIACEREIKEELGLNIAVRRLLCLDYRLNTDEKLQDESLQFIFDGGVLTDEQKQAITLNPEEHSEYRFVPIEQALHLLFDVLSARIPHAMQAMKENTTVYLEGGKPLA